MTEETDNVANQSKEEFGTPVSHGDIEIINMIAIEENAKLATNYATTLTGESSISFDQYFYTR